MSFLLLFGLLLTLSPLVESSALGSLVQFSRLSRAQALLGLSLSTASIDNNNPSLSTTTDFDSSSYSERWSFGSSRSYIYGGKQALNALSRQISELQSKPISDITTTNQDVNTKVSSPSFTEIYNEIGNIERMYRLRSKLSQFILESSDLSPNTYTCVKSSAEKAIYDINTINEYFSISNDGMKKVMIADSFQGQKLQFVMQGLASLQADLQATLFCSSS